MLGKEVNFMFDVQDMETGELVLEMVSAESLVDFADNQFPFEDLTNSAISGVVVERAKNILESRGFKVYQID
jgi:hypothetical protein